MNLELQLPRWTQSSPRTGGVLIRLVQYTTTATEEVMYVTSEVTFRASPWDRVFPSFLTPPGALIMSLLFG